MPASRSSILISVLAVALVALGAALLWITMDGDQGGREPPDPVVTNPAVTEPATEPESRPTPNPGVPVEVTVTTRVRGRIVAPVPPPVSVSRAGDALPVEVTILAGPGAALPAATRGQHLLRIVVGDAVVHRFVDFGSGGRVVELALGEPFEVSGRIVDDAERPIVGATVWAGETVSGERITVSSNEAGRFVLRGRFGSRGTPLVVCADGMASAYRELDTGSGAVTAHEVILAPARVVRFQAALAVDDPTRGRVALVPEAADVALAIRHYPFFLAALEPARCALDADGACVVADLPRRGVVMALLDHPRAAADALTPKRVDLGHDIESVVLAAAVDPVVHAGRVLDDRGRPVAGARIEIQRRGVAPTSRADGWMLPGFAHLVGARRTSTAGDGRFRLAGSEGGGQLLAIGPDGVGLELDLRDGHSLTEDIALPPPGAGIADRGRATLRLLFANRGRTLRVRVDSEPTRSWSDTAAFEIPFADPVLLDLQVRVEDQSTPESSVDRTWAGLVVSGVVEVEVVSGG